MNEVKGFKVFNPDWTCRGFQYEIGKTFEENITPKCCDRGFHFCKELNDCFNYYSFNPKNKVAKVIALGQIDEESDNSKCCTNKIQIVEELTWEEVLRMVNLGKFNSGNCNTGNRNTGNRNTGDWNIGDCNIGDWNIGDCNIGDWNIGDWNIGDRNTGNRNTGDWNTGDKNTGNCNTGNRNTGDWNIGDCNKSSFNNGCFMTEEPKIMLFNKLSDWTYRQWLESGARCLLNRIRKNVVEWTYSSGMTDEEKAANPSFETTGGYLKVLDESECGQLWWNGLSESNRNVIRNIPNFDAEIFEQVTGIKVG